MQKDIQDFRQIDKNLDNWKDRQVDRQMERQVHMILDRQIGTQIDGKIDRIYQIDRGQIDKKIALVSYRQVD